MFDLERFVSAQERVFDEALDELRSGSKRSHWMWFVFPQLDGLGHSAMARRYGITSLEEARAFLTHPVLGPRLRQCTGIVAVLPGTSLQAIFGSPDDMKFCSSMTLFALAAGSDDTVFKRALERWCEGRLDDRTVALLKALP